MTLFETIRTIERVASRQPAVKHIVENDIFLLNDNPAAQYGAFAFTQGQHTTTAESDFYTFVFTFFYVDRLTQSSSNQIEVQSAGVEVLTAIVRALNDAGIYAVGTQSFETFRNKFIDECAGVMCNVSFHVSKAMLCNEDYADFNDDFNDDYLIR